MFTDEIYEQVLIEKGGKPTTAHAEVCRQKLVDGSILSHQDFVNTLKQIENGYQLFRRRHPEYAEWGFRRHCWVQQVVKRNEEDARELFRDCGWKELTPEQIGL